MVKVIYNHVWMFSFMHLHLMSSHSYLYIVIKHNPSIRYLVSVPLNRI